MADARQEGRQGIYEIAVATLEDRQTSKSCRTSGWDLLDWEKERHAFDVGLIEGERADKVCLNSSHIVAYGNTPPYNTTESEVRSSRRRWKHLKQERKEGSLAEQH